MNEKLQFFKDLYKDNSFSSNSKYKRYRILDNDFIHNSYVLRKLIIDNGFVIVYTPNKSPKLNMIENLW